MTPNCLIPRPMHAELQPGGMEIVRIRHCRAAAPFDEFLPLVSELGCRFGFFWCDGDGGIVLAADPELPESGFRIRLLLRRVVPGGFLRHVRLQRRLPQMLFHIILHRGVKRQDNVAALLPGPVVLVAGEEQFTAVGVGRPAGSPGRELEAGSLGRLAAVLAHADGYLGNDSGVTHLAAAAGCRTLALFGPSDADKWSPKGRGGVRVLRAPADCMGELPVESVWAAVVEWFGGGAES